MQSMWNWLLHLWAGPPVDAVLACPAPRAGEAPDPGGLYIAAEITSAWQLMAAASAVGVFLLLFACYQLPRASLNRAFVVRWWFALAAAGVLCALAPLAVWLLVDLHARPGSCSTRPAAFPVELPIALLWPRVAAGLLWGVLAFVLLSLFATRVGGNWPAAGGFFHYRGCPVPRLNPGKE
jgi:hypothetical protein